MEYTLEYTKEAYEQSGGHNYYGNQHHDDNYHNRAPNYQSKG